MCVWKTWGLCLAVLGILACEGCGGYDSQGRLPVTGRVTLNGIPLERGSIRFEPQDGQQSIVSGAMIVEGQYTIPGETGLPPGKYLVRIHASDSGRRHSSSSADAPGPDAFRVSSTELIPPEFNTKSEQIVEVRTGRNDFKFDIASRK